jgi:hypothetical protein
MENKPVQLNLLHSSDELTNMEYLKLASIWRMRFPKSYQLTFQNYSSFRQDYIVMQYMNDYHANSSTGIPFPTGLPIFTEADRNEFRSICKSSIRNPMEPPNQQWFKKVHYMRSLKSEILFRLNVFVDYSSDNISRNVKNLDDLNPMQHLQCGRILPLSECDTWLLTCVINKVRSNRMNMMLPINTTLMFSNDSSGNQTMRSESHCSLIRLVYDTFTETIQGFFQDTSFSADVRRRYENSRLVGNGGRKGYHEVKREDYWTMEEGEAYVERSEHIRVRVWVFLKDTFGRYDVDLIHGGPNNDPDLQPWKLLSCGLANAFNMLIGREGGDNSFLRKVAAAFYFHPCYRYQKPPTKDCEDRSGILTLLLCFQKTMQLNQRLFLPIDPYCEMAATDVNDDLGYTVCAVCDQSDHEETDMMTTIITSSDTTNLLMVCDEPMCNYAQHNGSCGAGFVGHLSDDKWYCPEHRLNDDPCSPNTPP